MKGAYQVPLVVINSDDTKREFRDEMLSEWNLFDYFASWLGVETPNIPSEKYRGGDYHT